MGARPKEIVTVDDRNAMVIQDSAAAAPTIHISHPDVARIIKEQQNVMMFNAIPQPLVVTLNTSAHEIPSQIMESFGEQEGDSGQQLISIRNNLQMQNGMA